MGSLRPRPQRSATRRLGPIRSGRILLMTCVSLYGTAMTRDHMLNGNVGCRHRSSRRIGTSTHPRPRQRALRSAWLARRWSWLGGCSITTTVGRTSSRSCKTHCGHQQHLVVKRVRDGWSRRGPDSRKTSHKELQVLSRGRGRCINERQFNDHGGGFALFGFDPD